MREGFIHPSVHGTMQGYRYYGCACHKCRSANAAKQRAGKARRSTRPASDVPHGTWTGYNNWGCKCDECREASRRYRGRGLR